MEIIMIIVGILFIGIVFLLAVLKDESGAILATTILIICGSLLLILGVLSHSEQEAMRENNINPTIIEYITDIRNQKNETSITTADAIAVYIECKRNGFSEEEIMLFLLPDITEDEAKSIIKTYNLLEEEN